MFETLLLLVSGLFGPIVGVAIAGYLFQAAGVTDSFALACLAIGFGAPAGYVLERLVFTLFERGIGVRDGSPWFLTLLAILGTVSAMYSILAIIATASLAAAPPNPPAPWMDAWVTVFAFSVFLATVSPLLIAVRRRRNLKMGESKAESRRRS